MPKSGMSTLESMGRFRVNVLFIAAHPKALSSKKKALWCAIEIQVTGVTSTSVTSTKSDIPKDGLGFKMIGDVFAQSPRQVCRLGTCRRGRRELASISATSGTESDTVCFSLKKPSKRHAPSEILEPCFGVDQFRADPLQSSCSCEGLAHLHI